MESSAVTASAAVADGGRIIAEFFQNNGMTHSATLLPMVEAVLKNCMLTADDMDYIAVSKGPGSFTGIRIGVATAKGLAWASGKPCCGVSTLEAMAMQVLDLADENTLICAAMDARRSQIYNAVFEKRENSLVRLTPDRAIALAELENTDKTYLVVGDGAVLCYNYMTERGMKARLAPESLRYQRASGVIMASSFEKCTAVNELVPAYLRLSQAERERLNKIN